MKTNFETLRDMYRKEGSDLFRVRTRSARGGGGSGKEAPIEPIAYCEREMESGKFYETTFRQTITFNCSGCKSFAINGNL